MYSFSGNSVYSPLIIENTEYSPDEDMNFIPKKAGYDLCQEEIASFRSELRQFSRQAPFTHTTKTYQSKSYPRTCFQYTSLQSLLLSSSDQYNELPNPHQLGIENLPDSCHLIKPRRSNLDALNLESHTSTKYESFFSQSFSTVQESSFDASQFLVENDHIQMYGENIGFKIHESFKVAENDVRNWPELHSYGGSRQSTVTGGGTNGARCETEAVYPKWKTREIVDVDFTPSSEKSNGGRMNVIGDTGDEGKIYSGTVHNQEYPRNNEDSLRFYETLLPPRQRSSNRRKFEYSKKLNKDRGKNKKMYEISTESSVEYMVKLISGEQDRRTGRISAFEGSHPMTAEDFAVFGFGKEISMMIVNFLFCHGKPRMSYTNSFSRHSASF